MKQTAQRSEDMVMVQSDIVVCDGGNVITGHPQVFLHIDHDTGEVVCPYCEKRFMRESD